MSKARVLLVEDSESQAGLTRSFLEKHAYEVTWARDGLSAIKAVKTSVVDIIILDLLLPDMSGNEVCRWLKLNADTKGIPIIMLTVKDSLEDKVAGIEAGADDYLPKPYNETELNAKIYSALRTKALQDELRQKNKEMEELLARVEFLAITDPLTELYNRRRLENVLEQEWKKIKRYKQPITCMMIDIDHFKSVNDVFGHKAGDAVLVQIAKLIKKNLREVDTVARWGGEEFVVILPQTDADSALSAASRILEAVSTHEFPEAPARKITVSIGIARTGHAVDTADKLLNLADCALYEAKARGRNRIEVASEEYPPKSSQACSD